MRRLALLFRAVNVGGGGKLPMADLKALLAEMGYDRPETLLASGNAVVGTTADAGQVARDVQAAVATRFDLATTVLVRDAAQMAALIAANPFTDFARDDPSRMAAMFLDGEPDLAGLPHLAPYCGLGEEIAVGPACLYIAYRGGQADTKLVITTIEKRVGAKGTGRNWNTVLKLAERLA